MRPLALLLSSLFVIGCDAASDPDRIGPPPDDKADDPHHIQVGNCELFIDKVSAYDSSHGLRVIGLWIKSLPWRLDGEIAEVGFRYRTNGGASQDWSNRSLQPYLGSADYFSAAFDVSSDFGRTSYEGAFYVLTDRDTNYWFKPAGGGNFYFDIATYDDVIRASGYTSHSSTIDGAVATQRDDLAYFNPARCY